jgi:hypothetical protein
MPPFRIAWICLAISLALHACGPVPRPFSHQQASPLLDDPRVISSVKVLRVEGAPGLAEAMAKSLLDYDDMLATTGDAGRDAMRLSGVIANNVLTWRLNSADGQPLQTVTQTLPPGGIESDRIKQVARTGADLVATALRGKDSGASDLDSAPHVILQAVKAPIGIDSAIVSRAMAEALAVQGLAIRDDTPIATIDGHLRVSALADHRDLVEIAWIVRDMSGREIGTITQGSPVEHAILLDQIGLLARQIAAAAAPGVAEVVRHAQAVR